MADDRPASVAIGIIAAVIAIGIAILLGSNLALRGGRGHEGEPGAGEHARVEQAAPAGAPAGGAGHEEAGEPGVLGQEHAVQHEVASGAAANGHSLVEQGEDLVQKFGCTACHSLDGSPAVGPTFKGLFGRTTKLQGGGSVTVDEAYVRESILDPDAKVVAGFPPGVMAGAMMAVRSELEKPENLDAILAFLKTLK